MEDDNPTDYDTKKESGGVKLQLKWTHSEAFNQTPRLGPNPEGSE